jgi:class 3 adenylate cyclase
VGRGHGFNTCVGDVVNIASTLQPSSKDDHVAVARELLARTAELADTRYELIDVHTE